MKCDGVVPGEARQNAAREAYFLVYKSGKSSKYSKTHTKNSKSSKMNSKEIQKSSK